MDWLKDALDKIDKHLEKQDVKLDKQDGRMDALEKTSAKMATDLEYHIKRTDLLENELKPIKTKYEQVTGVAKFAGLVAGSVGAIEAAIHFLKTHL